MTDWLPTNKWMVATVTGAGSVLLALWTGNGAVDTPEEKALIVGFLVQRIVAYLARNEEPQ